MVAVALAVAAAAPAANADGTVVGWGAAVQVGLGSSGPTYVSPTEIPEAAAASAAAFGVSASYLVTPAGILVAGTGNVGLGATNGASRFTLIPDTEGATAVAAGTNATLILRDGKVLGFGVNTYGAAGVAPGSPITRTPTPIADFDGVVSVATGANHSVALKADGTVWNWGRAQSLGSAAAQAAGNTATPKQVALPSSPPAVAIAAGYTHSLALLQDGSVWAWGVNTSGFGEIGNGSTSAAVVADPVQVIPPATAGAAKVVAVNAGTLTSFAVYDDGTFQAWGANTGGQLGLGNGAVSVSTPTAPSPAIRAAHPSNYPPITAISSVGTATYAIAGNDGTGVSGRILGWGRGTNGRLGFGDASPIFDFALPYTGAPGLTNGTQINTEVPQRIGRTKGASWFGVGAVGTVQIAPVTPTLRGIGTGADEAAFFTQPVGTVSARQTRSVTSVGDVTNVTSITIVGANADDFEIVRSLDASTGNPLQLPFSLGAGKNLSVQVRFVPTALGERHASVRVHGDSETVTIALSGYGTDLPGNTPGPKGEKGDKGETVVGPPGPAGKNGIVTFAAREAATRIKRGKTARLSFTLRNATTARLAKSRVSAVTPRALRASGRKSLTVAALSKGHSRVVTIALKIGDRAKLGAHRVEVRFKVGARTVTRTVLVRVVR